MSKAKTRDWKRETQHSKSGDPTESLSWGRFRIPISDFRRRAVRSAMGLLAAMTGLAAAHPVLAQGCALCYNTAAAANNRGLAALRHGILILMIPPVMITVAVCLFAVRGKDRFNDEPEEWLEG